MNRIELLRNLPSVDEVLRDATVAPLQEAASRPRLVRWVRDAIAQCRQRLLDGQDLAGGDAVEWICDRVRRQAAADRGQSVRAVINATGVLLHTNLGRAPLAERAVARMLDAAAFANVELDLESGKRNRRGARAAQMLADLVGAEDAVVVNNCAAATLLVLQAVAAGREVVVSRGQLVEIGGGFRLPEVFAAAGVTLREVGTTNRTYLRDYEAAVGEQTGAIIRVHRSNFLQTGFVTEPSIRELVSCPRPSDVPVIDDLGSGCLYDLSPLGIREPLVTDSVAAGAELLLFSGDKLFGGPQCGIVVGRRSWIERLRRSPMMRAMRVDKLTLAALEATAEIHLAGAAFEEIPLLRMLTRDAASIRGVCERLRQRLSGIPHAEIQVTECESPVGGGAMPGVALASWALRVACRGVDALAGKLRTGAPAIQCRIADDSLLLDLRTVADHEVAPLETRLAAALEGHSETTNREAAEDHVEDPHLAPDGNQA